MKNIQLQNLLKANTLAEYQQLYGPAEYVLIKGEKQPVVLQVLKSTSTEYILSCGNVSEQELLDQGIEGIVEFEESHNIFITDIVQFDITTYVGYPVRRKHQFIDYGSMRLPD